MQCNPAKVDKLKEAIALDFDGREMYDDFFSLMSRGNAMVLRPEDVAPAIEIGTKAPGFELVDQDGKKHTLESYAGKVVVMDWWGIW